MKKGFCQIEINKLVKAKWNYKKDDDNLLAKLKENIVRNGQIENIIVRELGNEKFEVVNGNHRIDAFMDAGISDIYAFNLGTITDSQAKRIAIETNETRFESNIIALNKLLYNLTLDFDVEDLLQTLPFDDKKLMTIEDVIDGDNGLVEPSDKQKETDIFDGFIVVIKATHEAMPEIEVKVNEWQKKYGIEINIS